MMHIEESEARGAVLEFSSMSEGAAVGIEAQMNHLVNENHAERGRATSFVVRCGQFDLLMTAIDPPSHSSEAVIPTSPTRGKPSLKEKFIRGVEETIEEIVDVIPLGADDRHGESIGDDTRNIRIGQASLPLTRKTR